jgi:RNA polymerase sigma-70 factor (ECF subfamily)
LFLRSEFVLTPETLSSYTFTDLIRRRALVELYTFDDDYVQRLRDGDPPTQQHFIAYFSELLAIKLRARLFPPHVIDDIRQETFVRVLAILQKDGGLRQSERLGAFVNSVCNNVIMEQYRSSARASGFEEGFDPPDKNIDMDRALVSDEAKKQVNKIMAKMPDRDRRLLKATFLDEMDKDQVCREFGVDRDYLRVLLYRAKLQFRALYEQGNRRAHAR